MIKKIIDKPNQIQRFSCSFGTANPIILDEWILTNPYEREWSEWEKEIHDFKCVAHHTKTNRLYPNVHVQFCIMSNSETLIKLTNGQTPTISLSTSTVRITLSDKQNVIAKYYYREGFVVNVPAREKSVKESIDDMFDSL